MSKSNLIFYKPKRPKNQNLSVDKTSVFINHKTEEEAKKAAFFLYGHTHKKMFFSLLDLDLKEEDDIEFLKDTAIFVPSFFSLTETQKNFVLKRLQAPKDEGLLFIHILDSRDEAFFKKEFFKAESLCLDLKKEFFNCRRETLLSFLLENLNRACFTKDHAGVFK